jgi:hypothetical protein
VPAAQKWGGRERGKATRKSSFFAMCDKDFEIEAGEESRWDLERGTMMEEMS